MSKVHASGPDDKVVITLNKNGQPNSDDQKVITELSNFLGTVAKDNVSLTYVNWHVVPAQLKKQMWEYTLFKCRVKTKYYNKYETDEERLERRPETVPLEDFKMLLRYWGDEAVQSLADDNVAHRNTITETHTMEKLDPNIVEPVDAEIYLETYKRKPGRKYKTDVEEQKTKYMKIKALVDSGNIAEANAMVSGGKKHGRTWLVGRQGQKSVETSTLAGKENYVQEMTLKIRQELEANLEAKVNLKVKENMSWLMHKLGEANPGLKLDVGDFCATLSSDQDDNGLQEAPMFNCLALSL
ncbi:uncharacterized protein LOC141691240 [Apium graveolens]|uniref:uncharacterized protein LOC141691240 n=1 Tax=Apium graveolens TaxID=4045 RepID=UPI003D7A37E3